MATLVVAEKPSVARDIARVLGAKGKGEGCFTGGGYVVTWALGHLVALCDPDEIDPAWKAWRRETLPMLPEKLKTKVLPKTRSQFSAVKKLMLSAEVSDIICATDSGREGELIFRYIYRQAGCKKPVRRLWISSMTDAAIREGFANLRPGSDYDALYASAKCRSEADWLVGMNASRAFTLRYGALLSLGRVQTPTLALVVKRDLEIERFVPRDYWELTTDFGDYTGLWMHPKTKETRSFEKETLERAKAEIKGKKARVAESTRENKRQKPPQLYDLTSLQRDANVRFSFSAKKTLDIAQSLYEKHKLLTYPRTDSRCLPDDMAPKITKALEGMEGEPAVYAQRLLPSPPRPKRVYDNSKISDHHAIVPTGVRASGKSLTADEAKIFDLVARRLVAALYPDYEYLSAKVITECEGHLFKSTGNMPLKMGWRELYKNDKAEHKDGEENQMLPPLQKGDERSVLGAKIAQKKEKPPARLTAATLLGQMEQAGKELEDEALRETMKDSGLGTPATRAAIIERLKQVGYIQEKGKLILSTEKGRKLIAVVPEEISSAETTGRWERALNKMARAGSAEAAAPLYEKFMGSIRRYSTFLVEAADRADPAVVFEKEPYKPKRTRSPAKRTAAKPKQ
ncbi:MAG: DNA topoisomerase 3 [Eubacteriales bacterium]|nr:DNA topoisomerase 3 [Eubacteriales bacterium]